METSLYIVPTPVGNLEDITYRAIRLLKEVDFILAEDTRVTKRLLNNYEISTPLRAFHMNNEHKLVDTLVMELEGGAKVAMVSDAGTPGISDPGFLLVREAIKKGVVVETLPGATAFVPALVNSGLPCDKFVFEGFLPHKKGRQTRLTLLAEEVRTIVFYESPHRLNKSLKQMIEYFGEERRCSVARELTKIYEEHQRGTLKDVLAYYEAKPAKGEIVIILEGKQK